jgi:uncharacterized damage-inducible protein DinB
MNDSSAQHFLELSTGRLEVLSSRIDDCLGRLTHDQLWWRADESQNAVANLILHLCGNVRQFTAAIENRPDSRDRDREFASRLTATTGELRELLKTSVAAAMAALRSLPPARLMEVIRLQNNDRQIMQAIYLMVAHFAEHTGQVIYATKLMTTQDLGYFAHLNKPKAKA